MNTPKHVVILGGGFGGIAACRELDDPRFRITLVDRQNHHLFQPLLYQVATAGLAAPDIAQPLRHIFSEQENVTTLMDEVVAIDGPAKTVTLGKTTLAYDYLIFALGARTGYFGHDEWAKHAAGLKTLDEATQLRRSILLAFERAESAQDPAEVERLLSFVIVGGGPTGVEMAGALAELSRQALVDDFRHIDPSRAHVHLIEAAPRLLLPFTESQSEYTRRRLEKMGVTVHLNTPVKEVGPNFVVAGDKRFDANVLVWAAGIEGSPVAKSFPNVPLDKGGRVQVLPDLSVPGFPDCFVIGDAAALTDPKGVRVPWVAPAATQMGKHAARQILLEARNKPRTPFVYRDKGSMATIGRSSAVALVAGLKLTGWIAWMMWTTVHLFFLYGMRNRLTVFLQWMWSYLAWQRGARIITGWMPRPDPGSIKAESGATPKG